MKILGSLIFNCLFIVSIIFQCISIYIYFIGFLEIKVKKSVFISLIFFTMILTKFIPYTASLLTKMLLFIGTLLLLSVFCFYGSLFKKIYHTLFLEVLTILREEIFFVLTYNYGINFETNLILPIIIYFLFNILLLIIVVIIVKFLLYFKADNELGLCYKEYSLLIIVPLFSLISILKVEEFTLLERFFICLLLLIMNICIMFICDTLSRKNYMLQKYTTIELQNKYYKESIQQLNEISKLRHDLKNILLNLDSYLLANKIKEARNQIKNLIDVNNSSYNKLSSCIPIDAILSSKLDELNKHNIHCNLNIKIPQNLTFDDNAIDLSAILGNLLDNSIEALIRLPPDSKGEITINIKYIEKKLVIEIINTSKHININFSDLIFKSEKKENRYGIGINSIKERVKRLNGYYDFSYKDGLFTALIILPV